MQAVACRTSQRDPMIGSSPYLLAQRPRASDNFTSYFWLRRL